jgi:hypothetical protein
MKCCESWTVLTTPQTSIAINICDNTLLSSQLTNGPNMVEWQGFPGRNTQAYWGRFVSYKQNKGLQFMFFHIGRQTGRQAGRQTGTQEGRQANWLTG